MFIAVKDTKIIAIREVEWMCRRLAKGLDKSDYWAWLESVTTEDEKGVKTYDFSGEDYEIVETNAPLSYESTVDGVTSTILFNESGHITTNLEGTHYHLKWDGSQIVKDDDALATYQLAEKWKRVRSQRDILLKETDWVVTKATETGVTVSSAWKTYRQKLRDVPSQSDPDNITWPTKPSQRFGLT